MVTTSMSKHFEHSNIAIAGLNGQLDEIKQILLRTHDAVMFQVTSIDSTTNSALSPLPSHQTTKQETSMLLSHPHDDWDAEASHDGMNEHRKLTQAVDGPKKSYHTYFETSNRFQPLKGYEIRDQEQIDRPIHWAPTCTIETSRNFFPETYTVEQRLPRSCLVVISSYEQKSFSTFKANLYRLFFMNRARQWCRINVSLEVSRSSAYWATTRTSQGEMKTRESYTLVAGTSLPISLLTKVQDHLEKSIVFSEDVVMHLLLSPQDVIVSKRSNVQIAKNARPTISRSLSVDAMMFLHDLGCPQYFEQEVVQMELLDPPSRFLSCLCGKFVVFETMFARAAPSPELMYNIRVLHCFRDNPAFAKLVGVVTDQSRTQLKSYLIELPKAQSRVQNKMRDPDISWGRRQKWARQLVEGVFQIHDKGFVVGNLLSFWVPVVIDETDCVHFYHFKQKFVVGKQDRGYYPPEFRHLRSRSATLDEAECPNVTSKSDIYQLGMLLWLLAENKARTHSDAYCMRQECNVTTCSEDHSDFIGLPSLPDSIPKYYRDMVDACRAEDFQRRPAAREILEYFPEPNEPLFHRCDTPTLENTRLEGLGKGLQATITCDACYKADIEDSFFHCNVCDTGDFDICHRCYAAGIHCHQEEHLLVDLKKVGGWKVPWRYHSKVQSSGHRDIFKL